MIAKIVTKHYETNNDSRYIDIGDDFKVYSTTFEQLFNRYYTYTSKLSNKKGESKYDNSELSTAISNLFDMELYNALIFDMLDGEFADKFSEIKNNKDFMELINEYGLGDLYKYGYLSCFNDTPKYHIEQSGDRFTAIKYTDKNGKTVIEKLRGKDVYIINNNGKTVEAYRTNFCG